MRLHFVKDVETKIEKLLISLLILYFRLFLL